ncbi:MAG TPA: hemolysin family protein [Candidatus Binatia bacterium]|nr:hemolysin family protein [Candidatus Binatia bacterium]
MSLLTWGIIFALILVNAVYVAAELAAVAVPKSRVQQRAVEGDSFAQRLLPILTEPRQLDRYIAASQVGITLSSLVLGAFGEFALGDDAAALLERAFSLEQRNARSTASIAVLVGLTVLQMVLGELMPKATALQHPTGTAIWTVVPMRWSLAVLGQSITVLNGSASLLLRAIGMRDTATPHVHSPREIEFLLAESREGGILEPHEHRRLRQALHLGTRTARELMVPRDRVRALDVASSRDEVLRIYTESPFTRLPVYRGSLDRILGLVHTRDVALHATGSGPFDLRPLIRPVLYVPRDLPADRLLARMREARRQMAIVCDQDGSALGIVSIDDILDAVLGEMADDLKDAAAAREPRHA